MNKTRNEPLRGRSKLLEAARRVGRDWISHPYYEQWDDYIREQWTDLLLPFLGDDINYSISVDLAAGHGRYSMILLQYAQTLHIVDINRSNVEFCRRRFRDNPRVHCHLTSGVDLKCLRRSSVTFVYCFDAMVHFDSDVVRAYLAEFTRVVRPDGRIFCHHSNYTGNPIGDFHNHIGWRNFMSKELFAHYASKEGLVIERQQPIDWGHDGTFFDCFSLLKRP
jgi:ubiquinone/menaquinone biosynthesis C-methylase UbiE